MGNQRRALGKTQRASHVKFLTPSHGHHAILVAEDGEQMEVTWDGDKWISQPWSYTYRIGDSSQGYMHDTFQGVDATAQVFVSQTFIQFTVNDVVMWDNYHTDAEGVSENFFTDTEPFQLQKWLKTGLKLAGRLRYIAADQNSEANVLHIGPGIDSFTKMIYEASPDYYTDSNYYYRNNFISD